MFKSCTEANKEIAWRLISLEQERILAEVISRLGTCETDSNMIQYSNFSRWDLLASLQALLIYCLLRLHDVPVGHDIFDVLLLTTVNVRQRHA